MIYTASLIAPSIPAVIDSVEPGSSWLLGTGNPKIPFFACPINRPFLETPLLKLNINLTSDMQVSYKLVSQIIVSFT